jgi:polar amino acid transport system substrate-binding protein
LKILALKLKDGSVSLVEAPPPVMAPGYVRVQTLYSAVSPGTEGTKITTGKKSLLGKARARPDQVRAVVQMARSLGIRSTMQKVRSKLEGAQPLGYSLAGVVREVGTGVSKVRPGDLVACGGGNYANHADEVVIPANLVVKVPDGVDPAAASLTTLGSIALQGIRLARPTLGEHAVVIGLGIVGLMAAQLLKANGCRVFGTDIAGEACDFALRTGSADVVSQLDQDPVAESILEFTRGHGADLVLICAATTSDAPVQLAGQIARQRGRVVVVGAVGMNIPREDYYRKEITFSVSCSYGPGRYDPSYEESGVDYPYGQVRWTEGRNMEAVLDLMASGKFDPLRLVTHRFDFAEAPRAYEMIFQRKEPYAGILLEYDQTPAPASRSVTLGKGTRRDRDGVGIGFVGAGSYAQAFLLPHLQNRQDVQLTSVFTRSGLQASVAGDRFGFQRAVATADEVLEDEQTQAVFIATRHDQHGPLCLAALEQGRHVFVEKPLCLTASELKAIAAKLAELAQAGPTPVLQVGYNRRFSPAARAVKEHFANAGRLNLAYRVNAGFLPPEHWTQDPQEGGGRILGEVCHFVDIMQYLTGAEPSEVFAASIAASDEALLPEDNVAITLRFADGSVGTIGYFAQGADSMPKERLEVFGSGRSAVLDNYHSVTLHTGNKTRRLRRTGKGQAEQVADFLTAIAAGQPAIPAASLLMTTWTTLQIQASLRTGQPVKLSLHDLTRES